MGRQAAQDFRTCEFDGIYASRTPPRGSAQVIDSHGYSRQMKVVRLSSAGTAFRFMDGLLALLRRATAPGLVRRRVQSRLNKPSSHLRIAERGDLNFVLHGASPCV
jgi:hypothetical protein